MTTSAQPPQMVSTLYWNYFIALERDLETVSRYVEFRQENFSTFSVELAHLLFAAASEVDVLAKALSEIVAPGSMAIKRGKYPDIKDYRRELTTNVPELSDMEAVVPRYNLSFKPWKNWANSSNPNPDWWTQYNNVKHHRDQFFKEGNLENALNALSGLLTLNYQFYRYSWIDTNNKFPYRKETTYWLQTKPTLLLLPDEYYFPNFLNPYDNDQAEYFRPAAPGPATTGQVP